MAGIRMMRLVTVILLPGLALAATASAAPIDRDGVKAELETASAPLAKAGGALDAAGPVRATPSSNRNEATQAGNPLSKIPLSALTATRERPLFSASRRPPALAIQTIAQPVQDPAPAPPAPPEPPPLKLIGTILSSATSVALLRDPATQAVRRLRVGEATFGWRVKTVSLRSVVVEKGEQSAILGLPEPRDAPGELPSPNSPPPAARTSLR
jgi:general secretion pathway protein N